MERTMLFSRVFRLLILALLCAAPAAAQVPGVTPQNGQSPQAAEEPEDPYGRTTPEGLATKLVEILASEDFARAREYLDLRNVSEKWREARGAAMAQQLSTLLDAGGNIQPRLKLSSNPEGTLDDGLAPELERIGTLGGAEGTVDLLAERVEGPEGRKIWLISAQTLEKLPELTTKTSTSPVDKYVPEALNQVRVGGAPIGHWLVLAGIGVLSFVVTWSVIRLFLLLLRVVWRNEKQERLRRLVRAGAAPLILYLTAWVFFVSTERLGVSVVAKAQFGRLVEILAVVSLVWLAWRVVDVFAEISVERMSRRGRQRAMSAAIFLRRGLKFLLAAVGLGALLDTAGVDVSAGLAALGIGGLALALGAQKTIENLVGSLTVIADQPARVGDFCKIGNIMGTVEDIGMRSTRIRTLGRTVVTIPNGEFSSLQIENYSRRDWFLFNPVLTFRYETTPDQIRWLLVELRSLLYAHPRIDADPARVRFLGLGADSLRVEIFAHIRAVSYEEFLEVQEDLTLRIMEITEESGAAFAFPSRTLYVASDTRPSEDKRAEAEAHVRAWREEGDLQLPRFHPDRVAALKDTLRYPPDGSAVAKETAFQPATDAGTAEPAASRPSRSAWRLWTRARPGRSRASGNGQAN